jgi:hypothetical protein
MVERGYRPSDAIDMAAATNAVLKSFRISLCSNAADALVSHIPDAARSSERLMTEMGLPEDIQEQLLGMVEAEIDPEGDEFLRRRIGRDRLAQLLPRTRLFLATALLQFDNMGQSPCLDYAPVSVQVVKALEFELRELMAAALEGYSAPSGYRPASREEETVILFASGLRDSATLGSLTHAFKAARQAQGGALRHVARRLTKFGMFDIMQPRVPDLILNDVLKRFRNGGAHEHAISYATCKECIDVLIGYETQPGLLLQVGRWRHPNTA